MFGGPRAWGPSILDWMTRMELTLTVQFFLSRRLVTKRDGRIRTLVRDSEQLSGIIESSSSDHRMEAALEFITNRTVQVGESSSDNNPGRRPSHESLAVTVAGPGPLAGPDAGHCPAVGPARDSESPTQSDVFKLAAAAAAPGPGAAGVRLALAPSGGHGVTSRAGSLARRWRPTSSCQVAKSLEVGPGTRDS